MSKAAVESHIGDRYQDLITVMWIVRMIDEQHGDVITKIEVDSTQVQDGKVVGVDDCVVHYESGEKVYCQVKRNPSKGDKWTFAELREDLKKAWLLWQGSSFQGKVVFYSQTDFGGLKKLRGNISKYPDLISFKNSLSKPLTDIYQSFVDLCDGEDEESIYLFLMDINYEAITIQQARESIKSQLQFLVTKKDIAFDTVQGMVSNAKERVEDPQIHIRGNETCFITRQQVEYKFSKAGICFSTPYELKDVESELHHLSAIGTQGFLRTIGGIRVPRKELDVIIDHVHNGYKTILVEGDPGSGKSCILLDLKEKLESDDSISSLFIQSRSFSDIEQNGDLRGRGMPNELVEKVSRMAEVKSVVVVMDSLDVLSISGNRFIFKHFTSILDRLRMIPNVTVIAACRSFDVRYDARLRCIHWEAKVVMEPWSWDKDVMPRLEQWGWGDTSQELASLLCNPQFLWMYYEMRSAGVSTKPANGIELLSSYLRNTLGSIDDNQAIEGIQSKLTNIALYMLENRTMEVGEENLGLSEVEKKHVLSSNIVVTTGNGTYAFRHQTYLDILVVRNALAKNDTLCSFVSQLLPVPFVRPVIRTYFFYLRNTHPTRFRMEVRAALRSCSVAFNFKKLIAVSLSEVVPKREDQRLVECLFNEHRDLFWAFYHRIERYQWYQFLNENWYQIRIVNREEKEILNHVFFTGKFYQTHSEEVLSFWMQSFELSWLNQQELKKNITQSLERYASSLYESEVLYQVIQKLTDLDDKDIPGYSPIAELLMKFCKRTNNHEDLLFKYIANGCDEDFPQDLESLQNRIRCSGKYFHGEHRYVYERFSSSEYLLEKALDQVIRWVDEMCRNSDREKWKVKYRFASYPNEGYNEEFTLLVHHIRNACIDHCRGKTEWWQNELTELISRTKDNAVILYIVISCLIENPTSYINESVTILRDHLGHNKYDFMHELASILNKIAFAIEEDVLDELIERIFDINGNATEEWEESICLRYLTFIPIPLRSERVQKYLDQSQERGIEPYVFSPMSENKIRGGFVASPISASELLALPNDDLLRVLNYYKSINYQTGSFRSEGDLIIREVSKAVSREPERLGRFLMKEWGQLDQHIRNAVLEGLSRHLHSHYGRINYMELKKEERSSEKQEYEIPNPYRIVMMVFALLEYDGPYEDENVVSALEACSFIVSSNNKRANDLVDRLKCYIGHTNQWLEEHATYQSEAALNSPIGSAITAALVLYEKREGADVGNGLLQIIRDFSSSNHPSVKTFFMERMLAILNYDRGFAWELFENVLQDSNLYTTGAACNFLYYCYYEEFEEVSRHMRTMLTLSDAAASKYAGRLYALCYLSEKISDTEYNDVLSTVSESNFFKSGLEVFVINFETHNNDPVGERSIEGINLMLDHFSQFKIDSMTFFRLMKLDCVLDPRLISLISRIATLDASVCFRIHGFREWLSRLVRSHIDQVLSIMESIANGTTNEDWRYIIEDDIPSILTELFNEGEERELTDNGDFLRRTIHVMDQLLEKGARFDSWYEAIERV